MIRWLMYNGFVFGDTGWTKEGYPIRVTRRNQWVLHIGDVSLPLVNKIHLKMYLHNLTISLADFSITPQWSVSTKEDSVLVEPEDDHWLVESDDIPDHCPDRDTAIYMALLRVTKCKNG